jgi:tRNA G18 (ribose-2'-O)-methylase SpoU
MRKLKNDELNRMDPEEFKMADKNPIVLVLDNLRSLNNVGSIFRTADAFRLEGIILCGITAKPPHRDIQKTALGATESVDWTYYQQTKDAIAKLKKDGYQILALEQTDHSVLLNDFQPENHCKYALILGNEVRGVDDDVIKSVDKCIEIPQFGTKHSFNVAVSNGITIWDILLKMNRIHSM